VAALSLCQYDEIDDLSGFHFQVRVSAATERVLFSSRESRRSKIRTRFLEISFDAGITGCCQGRFKCQRQKQSPSSPTGAGYYGSLWVTWYTPIEFADWRRSLWVTMGHYGSLGIHHGYLPLSRRTQ
jgi:hypothetical protein